MKNIFLLVLFLLVVCHAACWAGKNEPLLVPAPQSYVKAKGVFHWSDPVKCVAPSSLQAKLVSWYGGDAPFAFVPSVSDGEPSVRFEIDPTLPVSTAEGYRLTVTPQCVRIAAKADVGLYYGVQTLRQMIDSANGALRACTITDEPRFAYRGVMIDVSRHFRSLDFLKKQIDILSSFKINRLHLHLTDAAGWRLEIKRYPRLTEFAAWRPQAVWKDWNRGGNKYCERTDTCARGGFYTQDQMKELIAYAEERFVTIVPEIEMPSHSEEVTAAYPELSCTHQMYGQADYCIGNEKTFEFLENVLAEVIALFPSEYIHIGGDEASKSAWKTCPLCQERMQKEGLHDVDQLQSYMIHRIERYLNSKGRNLLGWDEIQQGGVAPNATVMSWRGEQGGLEAVRSGHRAIMTPGEYCYFDGYQDAPASQPEAIGGYLPLQKVYSYNPIPDSLSVAEQKLFYGVQGNLWTEYIPTEQQAEYMLYPRVLALAEVAWTQPQRKSWNRFRQSVLSLTPRLQGKGYSVFDYSREIGNRKEALQPIKHLAVGKKVTYQRPYWRNYPANGEQTLVDGVRGGWNYNDRRWQGFVGKPRMDVVIDLGKMKSIHYVGADFMQICGPDVFMPTKVIVSASEDGEHFRVLAELSHQVVRDDAVSFKTFDWSGKARTRYVRYQADADPKYGGVLFVDEIVVR